MVLSAWLRDELSTGARAIEVTARIVFALVIVRMGWSSLRRAIRGAAIQQDSVLPPDSMHFRLGLLIAVSNPLTMAFFAGFFFAHPGTQDMRTGLSICLLIAGMAAGWFCVVGFAATQGVRRMSSASLRWPEAIIGCGLLIYAGVSLSGLLG